MNIYNADGSLDKEFRYEYKYDKENNWTQQIEFNNDEPVLVTEREIEYY